MYFREHCPHEIPASFTVSWPSVSHPLQKTNRSHPQPIIHRLQTRCIVQDMSSLEDHISVRVYFTWHSMTTLNIFTIIDIKCLEYFRKIFFQFFYIYNSNNIERLSTLHVIYEKKIQRLRLKLVVDKMSQLK